MSLQFQEEKPVVEKDTDDGDDEIVSTDTTDEKPVEEKTEDVVDTPDEIA